MGVTLDSPWAGQIFAPPSPLDIATLETAIAAQLRARINQIEIAQFPDKPSAYRLTHPAGAALVAWRATTYGTLRDTAAVVQTRRLEFEITLLVRDLGWSFGAENSAQNPGGYALLETIRAALTGLRLPGCRKMYPLREQFLGRDPQGGLWTWKTMYALETVALEASTQDNYPVFLKGTALEESGQTTAAAAGTYTFGAGDFIQLPVGNVGDLIVTPGGGGNAYAAGTDYTLDAVNGIITRVSTGSIVAGATVNAAYTYADAVTAIAGGATAPTAPSN